MITIICWVCTSCQTEHLDIARSLADVCNRMLGLHQGHRLYEVFLHVMSTERDTVERLFSRILFCKVTLYSEHKRHLPIQLLITKLIVTKCVTSRRALPKGEPPLVDKGILAFKSI